MDKVMNAIDTIKDLFTGQPPPTVDAVDGSAVTTRDIKNVKASTVNMKIEAEDSAGTGPPGNVDGQHPPCYTASGGSAICADKISDVTVDGELNLSVSAKASKANAAPPSGP